ncbi:MAG: hypothetical protein WBB45_21990 [Cyclobacteriaceae bacterium]
MPGSIHHIHDQNGWSVREYTDAVSPPPLQGSTLFLSPDFLRYKNYAGLRVFDLADSNGKIWLRLPFARDGEEMVCLPGVPYGGMSFTHPVPGEGVVTAFLQTCLGILHAPVRLIMPPSGLPLAGEWLERSLTAAGLTEVRRVLNHHLHLPDFSENSPDSMQRRRYRKGREAGLMFRQELPTYLPEACKLISDYRRQRGHTISMSREELEQAFTVFPSRYHLFTVSQSQENLAVLVAVKVSEDILYYFMPANKPGTEALSPSVFMICELARWAQSYAISMLDLGPSLHSDGTFNESLAGFKERMGGITSFRKTFQG